MLAANLAGAMNPVLPPTWTAALTGSLFPESDRYRRFAKLVYPRLAAQRATLEACSCLDNGRVAWEPVLLWGVSLLQELEGVPDRIAVELLRYHAGWNFALNRQVGDPVFHPTSLVSFRQRLEEHDQSALGFTTILEGLEAAGLVSRHRQQRLDSTQMFGRVARMSRLGGCRFPSVAAEASRGNRESPGAASGCTFAPRPSRQQPRRASQPTAR
jgi:hypothetical protein